MKTYFLKAEDLIKFYDRIAEEFDLFVPTLVKTPFRIKCDSAPNLPQDDYQLKRYTETAKAEVVFNDYRAIEPIRAYLVYYKELACGYFETEAPEARQKPRALMGVKNCDLFALKVLDYVFLGGDEPDPLYKQRRESTFIITGDCPAFKETCFCRAFDINPFAVEGFDMNLSPLTSGYVVDVAGDRAERLAAGFREILSPASAAQLSGRAAKRDALVRRLEEHLCSHKIPKKETLKDIVTYGYNSPVWQEQMRTCVECGGCVFACDTCHCFLLADEPAGEKARRIRLWDGCLYKNFTTVAGGANPLKLRYMRLRNRYLKKFDFFIDNLGFQACCGCGRCIDVCPGKIDIRYILRKLYEEKYLPAR